MTIFQLLSLPSPVQFGGGEPFSNVLVRINGSGPQEAPGYVFRPVRLVPDTIAVLAERINEVTGSIEYYVGDGEVVNDTTTTTTTSNPWEAYQFTKNDAQCPEGFVFTEHAFESNPPYIELGGEYFVSDDSVSLDEGASLDISHAASIIYAFCNNQSAQVPEAPVPSSISPRQIRLWLLRNGISLSTIEQALSNSPEALVEWEYATEIQRNNPLVTMLAEALQIDADKAFREASIL